MLPANLNETTRAILHEATQVAREFSHEQVEPEHVLLAMLASEEESTVRLLAAFQPVALHKAIESRMTPGTEFLTRGKLLPSPVAQRVLEAAGEFAGGGFITPRLLLIALLETDDTIAADALREVGCTVEAINNAASDPLAGDGGHINGSSSGLVRTILDSAVDLPYRESENDGRLYVPRREGWDAKVKGGWEKEYCYLKNPGEDYFHLLLSGEIYLQRNDEKYCLNCALRMGLVTHDRLFWQHRPRRAKADA